MPQPFIVDSRMGCHGPPLGPLAPTRHPGCRDRDAMSRGLPWPSEPRRWSLDSPVLTYW